MWRKKKFLVKKSLRKNSFFCAVLEVLNKIRNESITRNIFKIQDNESIMCGFDFSVSLL